jgi:methionyl-tRNA formyltransferase
MDSGIDSGPIIAQEKIAIAAKDNMADLHERMEETAPVVIQKALNQIDSGDLSARKQSHIFGSYFPKKPDGDEIIDWSEPSQLIYDRIRARNPGPLNRTYLGRKEFIIKTASLIDYPTFTGTCGQVLAVIKERGVVVKTGDSAILVESLLMEKVRKSFCSHNLG